MKNRAMLFPIISVTALLWLNFSCAGNIDTKDDPGQKKDTTIVTPVDTTQKEDTVKPVTTLNLKYFLNEMTSFDAMTRFPSVEYESRQESSHDRRSKSPSTPEWFANDDGWGYERMEYLTGREEKVIFDENHPGVITRIWLTSFGSPNTVLRFYFDGATEPSWEVNSFNLRDFAAYANTSLGDGLAQPSASWIRGSSLYLPIPYAKSCKITIQELQDPITVSRYYHINYRRYPDDTDIETLTPSGLRSMSSALRTANNLLVEPVELAGTECHTSETVAAGASMKMAMPQGARSINSLKISVKADGVTAKGTDLDKLNVGIVFDGVKMVSVPLTYLVGAGTGGYYLSSWRFKSNGRGEYDIRWVMPYRNTAELTISNTSQTSLDVDVTATVGEYKWDSNSLYFHSAFHSKENEPVRMWSDYPNGVEWDFADIEGGRGIYSGDVYMINNHTYAWPGEGDEKIWVDDESFPSHFGTGVEDYFSFCGYFRFHTPFSGEPRLDSSNFHGINVHYRTRNLDIIPFRNTLRFKLEMQGHEAGTADVASAFFWYGDKNTTAK